jgi:tRNA modification GTPase
MSYHPDDTICAIATAAGGSARGMLRISGPDTVALAARLFEAENHERIDSLREPTALSGRVAIDLIENVTAPLPCELYLWPTDRSYTRQPVAELHTLGSPPLLEALLRAVCRSGARLAEPGEFTLRAFLAGRLDLTQAEAVLGVIDAQSADDLSPALRQLAGGLSQPLQRLREELLQLMAELEAGLDFVDEDIEFITTSEMLSRLTSASNLLAEITQQMASRATASQAARVALVGAPNVGKSRLFNALVARRAVQENTARPQLSPALVSPQHGTTRDYLTAAIELDGMQCELVDTAGLGDTENLSTIDTAAQSLAVQYGADAAIRLCCIDSSVNAIPAVPELRCDIVVLTKVDLVAQCAKRLNDLPNNVPVIATSSRTGEGLDQLCAAIRAILLKEGVVQRGQVVAATADRCRESIRLAEAALRRATDIVASESGDELVATELRTALSELGKVVGVVYTDDLLDRIFSTFCIGK